MHHTVPNILNVSNSSPLMLLFVQPLLETVL